jgi:hypothetical protein
MAITRQDWNPGDSLWNLTRKLLTNFNGLITGDFGILTRGTLEIGPSTTSTAATLSRGTKTITTAGTALALVAGSTLVTLVTLTASRTATGRFWYGSASAANAQTVELPVTIVAPDGKKIDLSLIYIDASVSGEAVAYEALT